MSKTNQILQNIGYEPNKIMSNKEFTAYNIDEFGNKTIMDTLIIYNYKDFWFNKESKTKGKLVNLIQYLGKAYNYTGALNYIKNTILIITPWQSHEEDIPERDLGLLNYLEQTTEHIFKLQAFALMVREYFSSPLRFGQFHIEDFDFSDFVISNEFRDYMSGKEAVEKLNRIEAVDKFKKSLPENLIENLPKRKSKHRLISILDELNKSEDRYEQEQFTKKEMGYD